MTITVETGAGLSNAVSYVSTADADAYWAAEADVTWSGYPTAEREAALVRATREIDRLYSTRFIGIRTSLTQALAWPRSSATTSDGLEIVASVPIQVKTAVIELARSAAAGDLRLVSDPADVSSETIKVGPIEISTDYAARKASAYDRIALLLAPVTRGASAVRVHRT